MANIWRGPRDKGTRSHLRSIANGTPLTPDQSVAAHSDVKGPPDPGIVGQTGKLGLAIRAAFMILVLPLASAFYLWQSMTISLPSRELTVSPRDFPTIVGVLMLVVSILIAGKEIARLWKIRTAQEYADHDDGDPMDQSKEELERITSWRDLWVTMIALGGYVIVFPHIGFFVSTFTFVMGLSTFVSPRKWLRNFVVALCFTVIVNYIFVRLLGVPVPVGLFLLWTW